MSLGALLSPAIHRYSLVMSKPSEACMLCLLSQISISARTRVHCLSHTSHCTSSHARFVLRLTFHPSPLSKVASWSHNSAQQRYRIVSFCFSWVCIVSRAVPSSYQFARAIAPDWEVCCKPRFIARLCLRSYARLRWFHKAIVPRSSARFCSSPHRCHSVLALNC